MLPKNSLTVMLPKRPPRQHPQGAREAEGTEEAGFIPQRP